MSKNFPFGVNLLSLNCLCLNQTLNIYFNNSWTGQGGISNMSTFLLLFVKSYGNVKWTFGKC